MHAIIWSLAQSTPPDEKAGWTWDVTWLYLLGLPGVVLATIIWWAYDKLRTRRRGW